MPRKQKKKATKPVAPPEEMPYWWVKEPNPARNADLVARVQLRQDKAARRGAAHDDLKDKGNELFKEGKYEEAGDMYKRAIEVVGNPSFDDAWAFPHTHACMPSMLNLIQVFLKTDDPEAAEDLATHALRADPQNVKARYRRGIARFETERYRAAAGDFGTVVKLDPDLKEALTWYRRAKDKEEEARDEDGFDYEDDHAAIDWLTSFREELAPDAWEDDPHPDDDTHSNTSDCDHEGNGTPCRYYNQSRCNRGRDCEFSHTPDIIRSVRDKLGRNVCLEHIFGICTHGLDRCYFSHSTVYLAPEIRTGKAYKWWEDKKEVGQRRQEYMELRVLVLLLLTFAVLTITGVSQEVEGLFGTPAFPSGRRQQLLDERAMNWGFTNDEVDELLCQGVKPWDDDAGNVMAFLRGGY
ncbi:TPR-like protein [Auriculariales sp. MPI-PUGE-AT-0066]|nr:TPR-like protein [Auriculariales sp. MPI-PUGE-AT-0066]